jgi:hypothetical protein
MIYVVGFIGLIGGFAIGQMVLYFLLRGVSSEDLLNDPYIKWKYGGLNWVIAIATCYVMIRMYEYHFS